MINFDDTSVDDRTPEQRAAADAVAALGNARARAVINAGRRGEGLPSSWPANLRAPVPKGAKLARTERRQVVLTTTVEINMFEAFAVQRRQRSVEVWRTVSQRAAGELPDGIIGSRAAASLVDGGGICDGLSWNFLEALPSGVEWVRLGKAGATRIPLANVWAEIEAFLARRHDLVDPEVLDEIAGDPDPEAERGGAGMDSLRQAAVDLVAEHLRSMDARALSGWLGEVAAAKVIPGFSKLDSRSPFALDMLRDDLRRSIRRIEPSLIRRLLHELGVLSSPPIEVVDDEPEGDE